MQDAVWETAARLRYRRQFGTPAPVAPGAHVALRAAGFPAEDLMEAADTDEALAQLRGFLRAGDVALVDARSPEEFTGAQVRGSRGGHIPGAVNIEWNKTMKSDGTFRSIDELQRLFQRANISRDTSVITYCQTGVRGAHEWFVLKYLLGFENVSLYEGSWEEWSAKSDLPISTAEVLPIAKPTKEPDPCE